jgi:hypothetical protein
MDTSSNQRSEQNFEKEVFAFKNKKGILKFPRVDFWEFVPEYIAIIGSLRLKRKERKDARETGKRVDG